MEWNNRVPYPWLVLLAELLVLLAVTACSSGPPTKTPENEKPAAVAQDANRPGIDLDCIVARLQNPPEAFHYSFKNDGSPHFVDDEADVTPQVIDGSFKSNASDVTKPPITGKVHAERSDSNGWRMAAGSLSGIAGLAGAGGLISQNAVREGTDKVNGYDTVKYSVDTTRGNSPGAAILLGAGGFLKGTVWVTSEGCPVKMSLDGETHLDDGSVPKDHYEEAIIKK
jgi:hypothetical protein